MGWGDEMVAAGQAQRLYDADPSTKVAIVGMDGKPRWHPIWDGNPIIATPSEVAAGVSVRPVVNGPNCRPYIVYPFTKETGWTFDRSFRCRDHVAKLYLTKDERERGTKARRKYGHYVLIEPYTKHENFRWPIEQWTEIVASLPDLTFVQHVHADSVKVPGAQYEAATFREACGLIASSDLYVRSESGLCHAAAALGARQVTIFGGCMDATVMGGYPLQACIVDEGPRTPCGAWQPCRHCAEVMAGLLPATVASAITNQLASVAHG